MMNRSVDTAYLSYCLQRLNSQLAKQTANHAEDNSTRKLTHAASLQSRQATQHTTHPHCSCPQHAYGAQHADSHTTPVCKKADRQHNIHLTPTAGVLNTPKAHSTSAWRTHTCCAPSWSLLPALFGLCASGLRGKRGTRSTLFLDRCSPSIRRCGEGDGPLGCSSLCVCM